MEQELDNGWDNFIETYKEKIGENFWTRLYEYAYRYMENDDPDSGICFRLREDAISNLYFDLRDTVNLVFSPINTLDPEAFRHIRPTRGSNGK